MKLWLFGIALLWANAIFDAVSVVYHHFGFGAAIAAYVVCIVIRSEFDKGFQSAIGANVVQNRKRA